MLFEKVGGAGFAFLSGLGGGWLKEDGWVMGGVYATAWGGVGVPHKKVRGGLVC